MSNGIAVVERIARDALQTLQGLTVDIEGTSYTAAVSRYSKGFTPEHLTAALFQLPGDYGLDGPCLTNRRVVSFGLDFYIMPGEGDMMPFDSYYNQFEAEIETLLQADTTRGGNGLETVILPPIPFPAAEGEYGGFIFNFNVTYEILLDKPFESARTY